MVAKLVGSDSAILGLGVHLIFSVIIGGLFGLIFGHRALRKGAGIGYGLIYGFIWWILGPLLIMPIWLGMGPQFSAAGINMSLPSLWGHLMYGFILGLVYALTASNIKGESNLTPKTS